MNPNRQAIAWRDRALIGASLIPPFAILWIAARKHWIPVAPQHALAAMVVAFCLGASMPRVFEPWHQLLSRFQSWVGRVILGCLLGILFLGILVPLGLWLRFLGRSFLDRSPAESYWHPARSPGSLRDQF